MANSLAVFSVPSALIGLLAGEARDKSQLREKKDLYVCHAASPARPAGYDKEPRPTSDVEDGHDYESALFPCLLYSNSLQICAINPGPR